MSKKEKIETIKEMAGTKKIKLLTDKEISLLDKMGYNISLFVNSIGPITIFTETDKDDAATLEAIAKKLDRRIIRFVH